MEQHSKAREAAVRPICLVDLARASAPTANYLLASGPKTGLADFEYQTVRANQLPANGKEEYDPHRGSRTIPLQDH
jgi:hypothetical protein